MSPHSPVALGANRAGRVHDRLARSVSITNPSRPKDHPLKAHPQTEVTAVIVTLSLAESKEVRQAINAALIELGKSPHAQRVHCPILSNLEAAMSATEDGAPWE